MAFGMSGTDDDPIVDLRYTGRPPGGSLCLFTFCPGSDGASEDHLAPVCFDRDTACVDLGDSPQRLFDLAPYFRGRDLWFNFDDVGDALDPTHATDGSFSPVPLVVPFDLAFERQPAILHDDSDLFPGIRQLALDLCDGVAGDLWVRPFVDARQAHFDVVDDSQYAGHAFRIGFRLVLLHVAANK